jgi:hypothetical protein
MPHTAMTLPAFRVMTLLVLAFLFAVVLLG